MTFYSPGKHKCKQTVSVGLLYTKYTANVIKLCAKSKQTKNYFPDLPMTAKDFATMLEHLIVEVLPKKLIVVISVEMIPLHYLKLPNQWI